MTTRILLIGDPRTPEFLQAAERRGIELVLMGPPRTLDLRRATNDARIIAYEPIALDRPLSALVSTIVDACKRYECSGIVALLEFGLIPAAMAAAKLGLWTYSLKAVRSTRDKVAMRQALVDAGLAQVSYASCRTLDEARAFFSRGNGPIIIKPASGVGSDGVARVDDASQLDAAWSLASSATGFTNAICETYIDGPEVSVEGYSVNGAFTLVAITDKMTNEQFLEVGHQQPTEKSPDVQNEIRDYVARVLKALGVTDGWSHTEVRLSKNGPVIIETHTRPGGGAIDLLTRRATGVSTYEVVYDFALGVTPDAKPQPTGIAAAVRFLIGEPKTIASIEMPAIDPARIDNAILDVRAGDAVKTRSASGSRMGNVIGIGNTHAEAIAHAEEFRSRIRVSYEESQPQWTTPAA